MKHILYATTVFLLITLTGLSQDYHMAQYDANILQLNPALTGERIGNEKGMRFHLNYRDQRANFSKSAGSYKSIAEGFDINVGKRFSIGQYYMNTTSISKVFRTNNFMLSGGYKIINDPTDKQNLSVGLQLGVLTKSYDNQQLTYGAQYDPNDPDGFNEALPTGETVGRRSNVHFSTNAGLYYRIHLLDNTLSVYSGAAVYNISKRYETILGERGKVPLKFTIHAGVMYKIDNQLHCNLRFCFNNKTRQTNSIWECW